MMRRCLRLLQVGAGGRAGTTGGTAGGGKRFVPPWEAHGYDSPDAFFSGVLRSQNPIQRLRRDLARKEEVDRFHDDQAAMQTAALAEESSNFLAQQEKNEEKERLAKGFLPYGATPKKYGADGTAAWGVYKDALRNMPGDAERPAPGEDEADSSEEPPRPPLYGQPALDMLTADEDIVLPYKEEFVRLVQDPSYRSGAAPKQTPRWPFHGSCGLVIDIDGVIYRSKHLLPGSDEAIQQLVKLRIPFCFMTNGGGLTEAEKASQLSAMLNTHILPEQIVLSHTPMQLMAEHYKDDNVLIGGSPVMADIARGYGFNNAVSMLEFQRQHPELVPFKVWPHGVEPEAPNSIPYPSISAIFSFGHPLDALNDMQVMVDICTAPYGQIGTGVVGSQTVPIYYSADDLLWATEAPLPRLGDGAVREMLNAVYRAVTGEDIQVVQYGKPRTIAYRFAQKRIKELSKQLGWSPHDLRCVAMVGDNLESDILGANAAGWPWLSVQAMTGIGSAPAAVRTVGPGDDEAQWLMSGEVETTPHYVVPSLDHFVRELVHFPEEHLTANRKKGSHHRPPPVNLREHYNFKSLA